MSFESLNNAVTDGIAGKNKGIPMGFDRLNRYIGIRKGIYTLVGGLTGSGKTSFVDDCYVLNPVDWALSEEGRASGIKLKIIYRSMERSRTYKLAKWICRKIFLDTGEIITVPKLLGWTGKMTEHEYNIFKRYESYVKELEEIVTIIDGPENPIGIAKELKQFALSRGTIEQRDEYNKMYVPKDPNEVVIVVIDHIGLLKPTKDLTTKKQVIDKMSEELRYARDFYGYAPVVVSQFNRDISNPLRIKAGDVEPALDDFKDSSGPSEDADVVLALFDPLRYKVADPSGYDLEKLVDNYGAKYFRSLRLIKNSYGEDDIRVGLGFFGSIGMFKELKKRKDMSNSDYETVLNKTYFLPTK